MKLTVTEVAVHKENESPVFGECVTYVKLDDQGAGTYIKIVQHEDTETNVIKLEFTEIEYILNAIEMLKAGNTDV